MPERSEGNPVFPTKEHQEIGALFVSATPYASIS
jgi:hypothetical protein